MHQPNYGKKLQPNIETVDGRKLQKESLEHLTERKQEETEEQRKYNASKNTKRLEEGPRRTRH